MHFVLVENAKRGIARLPTMMRIHGRNIGI